MTVSTYDGIPKAYIKDHWKGQAKLIRVGETIGDCKLLSISLGYSSVRLQPTGGTAFTLNLSASR
jgi:hypothetical protein